MKNSIPTFLYVYADWVGLDEPTLIGILRAERKSFGETYAFRYDESWIKAHGNLFLSADIKGLCGWQYTSGNNHIQGLFSDVLPNRWGRTLLRTQKKGDDITSLGILLSYSDMTRIGGLRFKTSPEMDFINSDKDTQIPSLFDLKKVEGLFRDFEKQNSASASELRKVIPTCCGLGGARPKANTIDENGILYVAKFHSCNDTIDVELWEHFAHIMASHCGINAATTHIVRGKDGHILLSRRFDRTDKGKRIHMASAMTLLGLEDGCGTSTGNGYLDIVDFIVSHCHNVEANLRELYRRVAFNICIGNSDDHFRNHSFLLTADGWTLSPAYDINPTYDMHQSLLIDRSTSQSSLSALFAASEDYMIGKEEALHIIKGVQDGMKDWRDVANKLRIPLSEQRRFEERFDSMRKAKKLIFSVNVSDS